MSNRIFIVGLLAVVIVYGMDDAAASTDYVEMLDDFRKKDGITKLFGLSGYTSSDFVNMTLTYPDESTALSSVTVTERGQFQTFVILGPSDPAGLYRVTITPYNSTAISVPISTSFFLADYDGMLDVHIPRNSVLECNGTVRYCMEPGITHIPKSFGVRLFNDDYDTHQIRVGSVLGDLILPDGDSIIFPKEAGTIDYNCVIHPWVDGKLHVSDVPRIKHVADVQSANVPTTHFDGITQNNISQIQYDTSGCGVCYVGVVTKIVDGDTIYIDKKPVRLALVNTPEKRETGYDDATDLVSRSCPVGSRVLVDVDDVLPPDGRGVNFAQVTCNSININESLMNNGLAQMYDSFCTESEFMYESWAAHTCEKQETISGGVIISIPGVIQNNTTPSNATIPGDIILNDDGTIVYITVIPIVILVCLVLFFHVRKNKSPQNPSFTDIELLE